VVCFEKDLIDFDTLEPGQVTRLGEPMAFIAKDSKTMNAENENETASTFETMNAPTS
jgi:phosphatidylserine decarboxylase